MNVVVFTSALYHACANSDECNDGLVCLTPNITGTAPLHLRVHSPTDKICLCDTENGYREKEHTCNDAEIIKVSLLAIAFVTCIRKILVH
ncbi:jg15858 [Pararge aegeria aegeria]|uniref:Jg15858 protein n=1 Tax=Pararge aegeria aegeria TaxID=348720 RepID=A0A8S4R674_9NEOP|nr:jg15858 [Pararge aegeria aegeria]